MSKVYMKREDWDRMVAESTFSKFHLDALKCVFNIFEKMREASSTDFSFSEWRPNLNVHTGETGDIMTKISFNDPSYGCIEIIGKDLLGTERK